MSDISPIGRTAAAALGSTRQVERTAPAAAGSTRQRDQVELSTAAQMLSRIAELPSIREDLVARVREEIAAGTYETDDKLDKAIDALFSEEFNA